LTYVLLRFTDYDHPFGIFKLFLLHLIDNFTVMIQIMRIIFNTINYLLGRAC